MSVDVLGTVLLAALAVRTHDCARDNDVADEPHQAGGRRVGEMAHPYPLEPFRVLHLDRDDNDGLRCAAATPSAVLDAPDQRLVDLHGARQLAAIRTGHGHALPLQHRPRHSIPRAQRPVRRLRRHAILCGRHVPRRLEPRSQRCPSLVENRSRLDGRLMAPPRAYQSIPCLPPRRGRSPAPRTDEPARPELLGHALGGQPDMVSHEKTMLVSVEFRIREYLV